MTYQDKCESLAPEIEVTREMLNVGLSVYEDWAGDGGYEVPPVPFDLIRRLYVAMETFRQERQLLETHESR